MLMGINKSCIWKCVRFPDEEIFFFFNLQFLKFSIITFFIQTTWQRINKITSRHMKLAWWTYCDKRATWQFSYLTKYHYQVLQKCCRHLKNMHNFLRAFTNSRSVFNTIFVLRVNFPFCALWLNSKVDLMISFKNFFVMVVCVLWVQILQKLFLVLF